MPGTCRPRSYAHIGRLPSPDNDARDMSAAQLNDEQCAWEVLRIPPIRRRLDHP